MRLDPEKIRDVMLFLEDELSIDLDGFRAVSRSAVFRALAADEAGRNDILYTIIQLHESGYIVSDFSPRPYSGDFYLQYVFYITPKGHELLAAIRNEENWRKKISPVFKLFGSVSLSLIETVAKAVTAAALDKINPPPSGTP